MENNTKAYDLQPGECVLELRFDSFPGAPLPDYYTKDIFEIFGLAPMPPVIRNRVSTYWHLRMDTGTYRQFERYAGDYVRDLYARDHVMEYAWTLLEPAEYARRIYELQAMLHGRQC